MADVFGIPSMDPNDINTGGTGGSRVDNKVLSALMSSVTDITKHVQGIDKNIKVISAIFKPSEIGTTMLLSLKEGQGMIEELQRNTVALKNLSDILISNKVKVDVTGEGSKFFSKFIDAATNESTQKSVEKFGDIFGNTIQRIIKLGNQSKKIDRLGKSLMGLFKPISTFGKGMMLAAGGVALFGLSLVNFVDAITWESILKFGAITTVVTLASRLIGKSKWNFGLAAGAIALLGLSIAAFNELITEGEGEKFALSLTIVGGALLIFNRLITGGGKGRGVGALGKGGAIKGITTAILSIAGIGGAIWVFNKAVSDLREFDGELLSKTLFGIGAATAAMYIVGRGATQIAMGAGVAAITSGALIALGYGLNKLLDIPEENLNRGWKVGAVGVVALGLLGLIGAGPQAAAIAIGAGVAAITGGALIALGYGLQKVLEVQYNKDRANDFKLAMKYSLEGLMVLAPPWVGAGILLAAPTALMMSGAILSLTPALMMISALPVIPKEKFENFGSSIKTLADTFGSLSIRKNLRAGVNMAILVPLSVGATMLAGTMMLYSNLRVDQDKIQYSTEATKLFVDGISDAFFENEKKLPAVSKGIYSFLGISTLAKSMADTVMEMANLEFYEREIINGKSVIVGSTKLSIDDFKRVGDGIGAILNAITEPLANIGGSKNQYKIGRFTVTNPFSNKVKDGIKAMTNIGSVFNPLTDIIRVFAENGVDTEFIEMFNLNLSKVLGGISVAFTDNTEKLKRANRVKANNVVRYITSLSSSIGSKQFIEGAPIFSKFSSDLVTVKDTINNFDIEKLTKFSGMIANLNEMAKIGAIQELVEKFSEFIEKFSEYIREGEDPNNVYNFEENNYDNIVTQPQPSTTTSNIGWQGPEEDKLSREDISQLINTMDELRRLFIDGSARVSINEDIY